MTANAKPNVRELMERLRDLSGDVADVLSNSYPHDSMTYRGSLIHQLYECSDTLRRHIEQMEAAAERNRMKLEVLRALLGGLVPSDTELNTAIDAALALERAGEVDPTPWCHQCGADVPEQCTCGPIADNN